EPGREAARGVAECADAREPGRPSVRVLPNLIRHRPVIASESEAISFHARMRVWLRLLRRAFALLAMTSAPRLHLRIDQPHLAAVLECHDLLEAFPEVELEIVPFGPAEMRRAQHVVHFQERMVAVDDRLLLVDVDRGIAWAPGLERGEQSVRRDQLGA